MSDKQKWSAWSEQRILFVAETAPGGGTETYLTFMLRELARVHVKVTLVVERGSLSSELNEWLSQSGTFQVEEVASIKEPFSGKFSSPAKIDAQIYSLGTPELIPKNMPPGKKLVVFHTYPRGLRQRLIGPIVLWRWKAKNAVLTTVSSNSQSHFRKIWRARPSFLSALPVPIEPPGPDSEPRVIRSVERVLAVGRLDSDKRPKLFVEIAAALSLRMGDRCPEFLWIGDGPEREELQSFVKERGLAGVVRFQPSVSRVELIDAYKKAAFFIHLSKRESLGLTPLEASAFGQMVFLAPQQDLVFIRRHLSEHSRVLRSESASDIAEELQGTILDVVHKPVVTQQYQQVNFVPISPYWSKKFLGLVKEVLH